MTITVSDRMLRSEPLRRCGLGECRGVCCSFGVWIDRELVAEIRAHSNWIVPHMDPDRQNPADWFEDEVEPEEHSLSGEVIHSVVFPSPERERGTSCVFQRSDAKCALQVAAEAQGLHPWRLKPFYCILHPLIIDDDGQITLYENEEITSETASCLRSCETSIPLLDTFEPELRYFLGDKQYEKLKAEN
jgi:hypothetical protein